MRLSRLPFVSVDEHCQQSPKPPDGVQTLKDDQKKADHQHDEKNGQIPALILLFAGCALQAVLDRRIETKPRLQSRNISIAEPGITVAIIQNITAATVAVQKTEIERVSLRQKSGVFGKS